jgi:acyl-CoA synthetase (NDP forming)
LQLEDVDGVVFLHTSLSEPENLASRSLLERFMGLTQQYGKPVAYYLSAASQELTYVKQNYNFPVFTAVVETIRALEMNYHYHHQHQRVQTEEEIPSFEVNRKAVHILIQNAVSEGRNLLLSEALQVLEHFGIPTAQSMVATTVEDARAAAEALGYPVAMKIIAEQVSHKSDVGGVQLNLLNGLAVTEAFDDMLNRIHSAYPQAKIDGVLVQPMLTGGRELILGGRQDLQFGPVVLVGLGGVFVEIFEEVVVRVAPLSRRDALEMIDDLQGAQILHGARGHKPSDIDALVEALLRLSQLLCEFPEIKELDINPLRLFQEAEGCRALDARIITK